VLLKRRIGMTICKPKVLVQEEARVHHRVFS
jgi:hypothetical protein